jgi:hypothetical protein
VFEQRPDGKIIPSDTMWVKSNTIDRPRTLGVRLSYKFSQKP